MGNSYRVQFLDDSMSDAIVERLAANVVTSENLAEFNAQRLGLAETKPAAEATPEPAAEAVQSEQPEKGDVTQDEATQQGERKPNPKLEKRFSEITRQREEARAEAQQEREARTAAEKRVQELENQSRPATVTNDDPKPRPEQFNDAYQYAEALAEYSAEKALENRDRQETDRKANEAREATLKSWAERIQVAKTELPDFEEMVGSADVVIPDFVRDEIIESAVGAKILYHLAENAEFARSLGTMSPAKALKELGKLEARFEKTETPPANEKPVVKASKAPAPITPIKGSASSGGNPGVTASGEFHGTYQQWRAARAAGKIR